MLRRHNFLLKDEMTMKKAFSLTLGAAAAALVTGCGSLCPCSGPQETTFIKEKMGVKPELFVSLDDT